MQELKLKINLSNNNLLILKEKEINIISSIQKLKEKDFDISHLKNAVIS